MWIFKMAATWNLSFYIAQKSDGQVVNHYIFINLDIIHYNCSTVEGMGRICQWVKEGSQNAMLTWCHVLYNVHLNMHLDKQIKKRKLPLQVSAWRHRHTEWLPIVLFTLIIIDHSIFVEAGLSAASTEHGTSESVTVTAASLGFAWCISRTFIALNEFEQLIGSG